MAVTNSLLYQHLIPVGIGVENREITFTKVPRPTANAIMGWQASGSGNSVVISTVARPNVADSWTAFPTLAPGLTNAKYEMLRNDFVANYVPRTKFQFPTTFWAGTDSPLNEGYKVKVANSVNLSDAAAKRWPWGATDGNTTPTLYSANAYVYNFLNNIIPIDPNVNLTGSVSFRETGAGFITGPTHVTTTGVGAGTATATYGTSSCTYTANSSASALALLQGLKFSFSNAAMSCHVAISCRKYTDANAVTHYVRFEPADLNTQAYYKLTEDTIVDANGTFVRGVYTPILSNGRVYSAGIGTSYVEPATQGFNYNPNYYAMSNDWQGGFFDYGSQYPSPAAGSNAFEWLTNAVVSFHSTVDANNVVKNGGQHEYCRFTYPALGTGDFNAVFDGGGFRLKTISNATARRWIDVSTTNVKQSSFLAGPEWTVEFFVNKSMSHEMPDVPTPSGYDNSMLNGTILDIGRPVDDSSTIEGGVNDFRVYWGTGNNNGTNSSANRRLKVSFAGYTMTSAHDVVRSWEKDGAYGPFNTAPGGASYKYFTHVAIVKQNNVITLYVDGLNSGTLSITIPPTAAYFQQLGKERKLYLGSDKSNNPNCDAWIKELKFSKKAMYTSAFSKKFSPSWVYKI